MIIIFILLLSVFLESTVASIVPHLYKTISQIV